MKTYAWYQHPEPSGREYTEKELEDTAIVTELFDYCQILLAVITEYGWQKLIQFHGYDTLIAINKQSGWFDETDDQEVIDDIKYHCHVAGYDPDRDCFIEGEK